MQNDRDATHFEINKWINQLFGPGHCLIDIRPASPTSNTSNDTDASFRSRAFTVINGWIRPVVSRTVPTL